MLGSPSSLLPTPLSSCSVHYSSPFPFTSLFLQWLSPLLRWARRQQLPPRETYLLDDNDGAGWKLAAALLRERVVEKGQVIPPLVS